MKIHHQLADDLNQNALLQIIDHCITAQQVLKANALDHSTHVGTPEFAEWQEALDAFFMTEHSLKRLLKMQTET